MAHDLTRRYNKAMSLHPRPMIIALLLSFILAGCTSVALPSSGSPTGNSSPTPFQPLRADTPAAPPAVWVDPAAPAALTAALPTDLPRSADADSAAYHLRARIPHTGESTANGSTWVYVLAAPFPTLADGITGAELSAAWKGSPPGGWQGVPFLLSADTLAALTVLWGEPAANAVRVLPADQILQTAWDEQHAWALLPFEALEPRWKVLTIDGISPLQTSFDPTNYPLTVKFALDGGSLPDGTLPTTNRDPQKLTTLVMTGVTGLGRAVGARMDANGVDYPARDIGDWLRSADITHISNEVSFATDCPPSDPYQTSLRFCAQPRYFDLLTGLGVDVVELTGNHNLDWGPEAASYSLQLYREANIPVFGGGADQAAARQPALIEHHGNRLAFLGCNAAGPENAWATDDSPGAAQCGSWLEDAVSQLKSQGYLPVVTFQWMESYDPVPLPPQRDAFRAAVDAGAVIVSGSQAHLPQTMEFYQRGFIHYGPGNLFFDQMDIPVVGTRREFVDRYTFYDGKLLQVELLTALLEDYARPRPMMPDERSQFLTDIFTASGW